MYNHQDSYSKYLRAAEPLKQCGSWLHSLKLFNFFCAWEIRYDLRELRTPWKLWSWVGVHVGSWPSQLPGPLGVSCWRNWWPSFGAKYAPGTRVRSCSLDPSIGYQENCTFLFLGCMQTIWIRLIILSGWKWSLSLFTYNYLHMSLIKYKYAQELAIHRRERQDWIIPGKEMNLNPTFQHRKNFDEDRTCSGL